ncbi:hypothetical protein AB0H73_22610 [Streptomyces olivoreticuli]
MARDFLRSAVAQLGGRGREDALGTAVLPEGEVARAREATDLGGGDEFGGCVGCVSPVQVLLGLAESALALGGVAQRRVGLPGVEHGEPGQGMAGALGRVRCLEGEIETFLGVAGSVQGDVAGTQEGVTFQSVVAKVAGDADALGVEGVGGRVVPPLGGVPDELAHEGGSVRLEGAQFSLDPAFAGFDCQEGDVSELAPAFGEEAGGRNLVIPFCQLLEFDPQ